MSAHDGSLRPRPRRMEWRKVFAILGMILLGVLAGIGGGLVIGRAFRPLLRAHAWGPVDVLAVFAAMWGTILAHELGHVIGGLASGMRFVLLAAGPLQVTREGGGLRVSYNRINWGGLAILIPRDLAQLRRGQLLMVAAGPGTSLVVGVAALATSFHASGTAFVFTMLLAFVSLAIAVATLIPNAQGGYASDGAQLLALLQRRPEGEFRALMTILVGQMLRGTRPRDLDREILARLLASDASPTLQAAACLIAALVAVDRGEPSDAHFARLVPLVEHYPRGLRQGLTLWLTWYAAIERDDAGLAQRWFAESAGGFADRDVRALATAAHAYVTGDFATARAEVAKGRKLPAGIDAGTSTLVQDLLTRLDQRLARTS